MSEIIEGQEPVVPDTPPAPTIEDQALAMGWRPKEEYEGDPDKWVSAETFVSRKPLFDKIEDTSKQNKQLKKEVDKLRMTVQELAEHNRKIRETEYERAKQELRAAKRAALAEEDHIKADEIQERIDFIKEQEAEEKLAAKQAPPPDEVPEHPAMAQWKSVNRWYTEDEEMKEYADFVGNKEIQKGNRDPEAVLKIVAEKVRKQFKDSPFFRNPMKDKAPAVETRGAGSGSTNTPSKFKPNALQKEMAKRFVETGAFKTEAEYYEQLARMEDQ